MNGLDKPANFRTDFDHMGLDGCVVGRLVSGASNVPIRCARQYQRTSREKDQFRSNKSLGLLLAWTRQIAMWYGNRSITRIRMAVNRFNRSGNNRHKKQLRPSRWPENL